MLTVADHIAIVQRAHASAATDAPRWSRRSASSPAPGDGTAEAAHRHCYQMTQRLAGTIGLPVLH
jgi:hypothetical protein